MTNIICCRQNTKDLYKTCVNCLSIFTPILSENLLSLLPSEILSNLNKCLQSSYYCKIFTCFFSFKHFLSMFTTLWAFHSTVFQSNLTHHTMECYSQPVTLRNAPFTESKSQMIKQSLYSAMQFHSIGARTNFQVKTLYIHLL